MKIELPPLPNPLKNVRVYADHGPTMREPEDEVFDAQQMRQYALDAIALTRPPGGSERLREALIARRSMFCGAMPLATVVDDAKLNSAVEEIDWMLGLLADQRHEPQGDVPFATVREVVRALTRLGRTTPCSQEEQAARAVELIGDLCREVQRHFDSLASPQGAEQRQEGWQRMTDEARAIQLRHLDDHQGDVYHAMQALATRYGSPDTRPMTQPATPPPEPAATQGDAVETIKRIAAQLATDDCEGDAADLLDALAALSSPPGVQADTWFGPDSSGGWYVKHGDLFFYARPQEMVSTVGFIIPKTAGVQAAQVPGALPLHDKLTESSRDWRIGWNNCRAEMLRRIAHPGSAAQTT